MTAAKNFQDPSATRLLQWFIRYFNVNKEHAEWRDFKKCN